MLSNLAALLNELDSASMTNASYLIIHASLLLRKMEASILGGWPLKILTAFSQLKLMKKCY